MTDAPPPVDPALVEQAVAWTREAGELTLGWFNHAELTIDRKADGTPVTQADRAAERLLRERIAHRVPGRHHRGRGGGRSTSGRRPSLGDRPDRRNEGVQPRRRHVLEPAVPRRRARTRRGRDQPARPGRDGLGRSGPRVLLRRSPGDGVRPVEPARRLPHGLGVPRVDPEPVRPGHRAGIEIRTWGDAYGYALVASGRVDAMSDPVLAWWDIAPMLVVVPEAGGTVTRRDGSLRWEAEERAVRDRQQRRDARRAGRTAARGD